LLPANACRICVVELEGARTLVPACSRLVEPDMVIHTDSERVRRSRKMVIELLASSVDLSLSPAAQGYVERYGADPARYGPPAPRLGLALPRQLHRRRSRRRALVAHRARRP